MQATPKLEEEFPTERMLSSEVSLGVDQTKKPESKHEIKALEVQGRESEEKLDKEQLKSKRRSNSIKITIGLLLLGFVLWIIVDTSTNGYVKDGIELFFEWIEVHPIIGFFSFVVGMFRNKWFCTFVASAGGMVANYYISTFYLICRF
jgi:hypothetical protein